MKFILILINHFKPSEKKMGVYSKNENEIKMLQDFCLISIN